MDSINFVLTILHFISNTLHIVTFRILGEVCLVPFFFHGMKIAQ